MPCWRYRRSTQYDMDIELHRYHLRQLLKLWVGVKRMSAFMSAVEVVKCHHQKTSDFITP